MRHALAFILFLFAAFGDMRFQGQVLAILVAILCCVSKIASEVSRRP